MLFGNTFEGAIYRFVCLSLIPSKMVLAVLCRRGRVRLFATPWTLACQAPLSLGILQARILEWFAVLSLQGNFPNQESN